MGMSSSDDEAKIMDEWLNLQRLNEEEGHVDDWRRPLTEDEAAHRQAAANRRYGRNRNAYKNDKR